MAVQLEFEGVGRRTMRNCDYSPSRRLFTLSPDGEPDLKCFVEYDSGGINYSTPEALVSFLYNPQHAEAEVRPVRLAETESRTVGWLCTLSALTSTSHGYSTSSHFRKAAFMAVCVLLLGEAPSRVVSVANDTTIRLEDLFDDAISLLILHEPSVSAVVSTDCSELLPSLFQFGFTPYSPRIVGVWRPGSTTANYYTNLQSNITLQKISRDAKCNGFARRVFQELLPVANDPVLRFFIFYQVIQALIDEVFADRQAKNILAMVPVCDRPSLLHPMIERLQDDTKEKRRLRLLFNEYSGAEAPLADLKAACDALISRLSGEESASCAEGVYEVRNILFHNFRSVNSALLPRLVRVVEELEWAVPELLFRFRLPLPLPCGAPEFEI